MVRVVNRDGKFVDFDGQRILNAVNAAFKAVTGEDDFKVSKHITMAIESRIIAMDWKEISVEMIESYIFKALCEMNATDVARAYEGYRAVQAHRRKTNTTDDAVLKLVNGNNDELNKENSNKDSSLIGTMRDYLAGIVSKDIARRLMIPAKIVQAHDEGVLWFHDMDYFITRSHNCCLVNLEDMFINGTVINDRLIETPTSFTTACTVASQIAAQIASGQYGLI